MCEQPKKNAIGKALAAVLIPKPCSWLRQPSREAAVFAKRMRILSAKNSGHRSFRALARRRYGFGLTVKIDLFPNRPEVQQDGPVAIRIRRRCRVPGGGGWHAWSKHKETFSSM